MQVLRESLSRLVCNYTSAFQKQLFLLKHSLWQQAPPTQSWSLVSAGPEKISSRSPQWSPQEARYSKLMCVAAEPLKKSPQRQTSSLCHNCPNGWKGAICWQKNWQTCRGGDTGGQNEISRLKTTLQACKAKTFMRIFSMGMLGVTGCIRIK